MMISKHVAQQIRAGITYARQVINKERTNRDQPRIDDRSLFAAGYWHTITNRIKRTDTGGW